MGRARAPRRLAKLFLDHELAVYVCELLAGDEFGHRVVPQTILPLECRFKDQINTLTSYSFDHCCLLPGAFGEYQGVDGLRDGNGGLEIFLDGRHTCAGKHDQ